MAITFYVYFAIHRCSSSDTASSFFFIAFLLLILLKWEKVMKDCPLEFPRAQDNEILTFGNRIFFFCVIRLKITD